MSPLRGYLWITILVLLAILGVGSVTYNHTASYVLPGLGSFSIGSGWSSLNLYLEDASRAALYEPGLDIELGKKIHGASSYDGMMTAESSKPPPNWTSFFTKLPGVDIQKEEVTLGIPYFWLIVVWILVGIFGGKPCKTSHSQSLNAEPSGPDNPAKRGI